MALQSYVTFFCSFEKELKIFLWSLLHTSLRLVNVLARARSGEKQRDHFFVLTVFELLFAMYFHVIKLFKRGSSFRASGGHEKY